MSQDLSGKTVIITGGASGIGLATARALSKSKAYVTILDIEDEAGQALAAELCEAGAQVQYIHCDVTSWEEQVAAFKSAIRFSPSRTLDIVVAAAGVVEKENSRMISTILAVAEPSLEAEPPRAPVNAIQVNLLGLYYTAWLACYYFRVDNQGQDLTKSLVLVASATAYTDAPDALTTYWAGKWGVRGIFHSTRESIKSIGARLNLIAPYWVDTPMAAKLGMTEVPIGGWAAIGDVVETIVDCALNPQTDGRAFGVFGPPVGRLDFEDNLEGFFGAAVVQKLVTAMGADARKV